MKPAIVAATALLAGVVGLAQSSVSGGTTRFVVDGNRVYAELGFVRRDGSIHRALAFVDMGGPAMTVHESLLGDLRLDPDQPLSFKVGAFSVTVPRADVTVERRAASSIGSDLDVEALLPASLLQRYQVAMDYQRLTLTIAAPGTLTPQGAAVPFRINSRTGLISIDASIEGKPYSITIDNGSAYTWIRRSAAEPWLTAHPRWNRGTGAVGVSNMMMAGDGAEASGVLLRIPEISLGSLVLHDVGALAPGSGGRFPGNLDLFDWYSGKNAGPVAGWLGGNVLKAFRLTIDYPNRLTYWLKQRELDAHDLDQVGLTLRFDDGRFFVAAVATKAGTPTVDGVAPGDRLVRIGDLDTARATWGAVYAAMHGGPGESRSLVLERNGRSFTVVAPVTAF